MASRESKTKNLAGEPMELGFIQHAQKEMTSFFSSRDEKLHPGREKMTSLLPISPG